MNTPQRATLTTRLRAFVRGALSPEERADLEALLDRDPEARAMLGVIARQEDGYAATLGSVRDPYLGATLAGRYDIRRKIGRGGMGTVYEAEHRMLGRVVALKLLNAAHAAHEEHRRRFEREARAVARLEHEHIVRVLDVGRTEGGVPFIVFEYLNGQDLESVVRERTFSCSEAARLGHQIAAALVVAHEAGVVHRDIKASNVVMVADGPKLVDFGISKVPGERATTTGAFMGTPQYMAPEQLADSSRVDGAADVYALGVLLFRVLCGEMPFGIDEGLAKLIHRKAGPPPSLRDLRPELPVAFEALVQQALSPERAERPSAPEMRDALLSHIRSVEGAASAPSQGNRLVVAVFAEGVPEEVFRGAIGSHGRVQGQVALYGEGSWDRELLHRATDDARGLAEAHPDALLVVGVVRSDEAHEGGVPEIFGRAKATKARGVYVTRDVRSMIGRPSGEIGETGEVADEGRARLVLPGASSSEALSAEVSSLEVHGDVLFALSGAQATERAPLLGRRTERSSLVEAMEALSQHGESSGLILEGPPGIGKSQLLEETARMARARGLSPVHLNVRPMAAHALLRGLYRALLTMSGSDAKSLLRRGGGQVHADADVLAGFSQAPEHTAVAFSEGGQEGQVIADRMRLSMLKLLRGAALERPLVLLVENVQWLTPPLRAWMERLGDLGAPILFVATSRETGVFTDSKMRSIRLLGLRRNEVRALYERVAGTSIDGERLDSLVERSEGNPFFVEQFAMAPGERLPINVEAAIQVRLEGLSGDERNLLVVLSIFADEVFEESLIPLLAPATLHRPMVTFEALRRGGLVRRGEGEGVFRFRSTMVAETASAMLSPDSKKSAHRIVAEHYAAKTDAPAARVAFHLEAAGAEGSAAWYARAAFDAARKGDQERTVFLADKAMGAGESTYRLSMVLAEAHELSGRFDEEEAALQNALSLSETGDERAECMGRLAVTFVRRGRMAEALQWFEKAEGLAQAPATRARVLGKYAVTLVYAGQIGDAVTRIGEVERLVMVHVPALRAELAQWRGQVAASTGDLADRRNCYWAAVELYGERGDRRRRAGAGVNLADVYNRLGAYEEACKALAIAIEDCEALGLHHPEAYARANLAYALTRRGSLEAARRELRLAQVIAEACSDARLTLTLRLYGLRIDGAEGAGSAADAMVLADECAERGLPALSALALTVAAGVLLRDRGDALKASRRAFALLEKLGSLEEDEAELTLTHALALQANDESEAAAQIWAQGRAVVEGRARRIGEALWRERFLREVPANARLVDGSPSGEHADSRFS